VKHIYSRISVDIPTLRPECGAPTAESSDLGLMNIAMYYGPQQTPHPHYRQCVEKPIKAIE